MKKILSLSAAFLLSLVALLPQNARAAPLWGEDNHDFSISEIFHDPQTNAHYALVEFRLKGSWATYWKNPGDAGLPFLISEGRYENTEKPQILWPVPQRITYGDGIESYGYKHYVLLPLLLKSLDPQRQVSFQIKGRYSVCDDICIPYEFDETRALLSDAHPSAPELEARLREALSKTPQPIGPQNARAHLESGKLVMEFSKPQTMSPILDIFVDAGMPVNFGKPQLVARGEKTTALFPNAAPRALQAQNGAEEKAPRLEALLVSEKDSYQILPVALADQDVLPLSSQPYGIGNASSFAGWLLLLLSAFLGGLILNIMPCVLPVVSLKLAQLDYGNASAGSGAARIHKKHIFFTILGIVLSLLLFALLIYQLQNLGAIVGWGFHFQEPVFVAFMMALLSFFTFVQFGVFNIFLPHVVSRDIDKIFKFFSPESNLFHVFYGAVITLLATPCTAPFLGSAVALALTLNLFELLLVFFFISLGLALPYILFLVIPASMLKNIIPKPGAWMDYVRYAATLLLAGSVLWLAWVLSRQIGYFPTLVIFLAIQVALLLCKADLKAMRPIALAAMLIVIVSPSFSTMAPPGLENKMPVAEFGLVWNPFKPDIIPDILNDGKVVFIDITASWCLTCQYNKWNVLDHPDIVAEFAKPDIYLMRGDLTRPNRFMMAYIQQNNRAGIPFNAVYRRGGVKILSEILEKEALLEALQEARDAEVDPLSLQSFGVFKKSDL